MRVVLRIVSAVAALSVIFTVRFIAAIGAGGLQSLLAAGPLGVATLLSWAVTLALGPFVAVQLWRYRENGRKAGVILFACGLAYYLLGVTVFRTAGSDLSRIGLAAVTYALPVLVLASSAARRRCTSEGARASRLHATS